MISNFDPIVSVVPVFSGQYLLHLICSKDASQQLVSIMISVGVDISSSFVHRLSFYILLNHALIVYMEKCKPDDEVIGLVHW